MRGTGVLRSVSISLGLFLAFFSAASCFQPFLADDSVIGEANSRAASKVSVPLANVSASSYDTANNAVATNAVDGNLTTRWAADGKGQYITFILPATTIVETVKIAWYKGNERASTFDVQSWNGTAYVNVKTGIKSSGTSTALESYSITATTTARIRLVGQGNTLNTWNSMNEVEIWGSAPAPSPSPSPAASVAPSLTPSVAPSASPAALPGVLRTIKVSSMTAIQDAMKNALPGDLISIAAGTYTGSSSTSGYSNGYFAMQKSGTASNPIYIQSETSTLATLQGSSNSSKYVLYIKGNYVRVSNLKITKGNQGLMTDQSDNCIYTNLEVYNIGQEGIHIRDGSVKVLVDKCKVYNTGMVTADYGEGIYVGSDYLKWKENGGSYDKACDDVTIRAAILGPGCKAEPIDIKEGASRTIVENCTMYGAGISGANSADSFMDVKGNDAIIRYNTVFRDSNSIITDAFQLNEKSAGWGFNNDFHHNTCNMDSGTGYIVNVKKGSAKVSANTRSPTGNMYTGSYTTY